MLDNKETVEKTSVSEVDIDLNALLGIPGGDSILTQETKPSFFSNTPVDIDKMINEKDPEPEPDKTKDKTITQEDITNIINPESNTGERKSFGSKADLVSFTNKLIEKKLLVPFDDDKKLEDYTVADFEELYEVNANEKEKKVREEVPAQFFQSLPEEMQYAAKYIADGGKDLKGLFQALAQSREIAETDITNEQGQESVVRSYLLATNYGTQDEIDEEIESMKDRDELSKKASKFKPKLDAMQNQVIAGKLQREEGLRKQREEHASVYTDNVYKVLEPGNLNGIKIDRKMQNLLFAGLVQPNYPSVTGKSTNLLGHLLERYQFVEPNHALVAEALYLLADPDGYRQKVRDIAKKDVVAETVRTLKTEQSRKISSSSQDDDFEQKPGPKIARPAKNFFGR